MSFTALEVLSSFEDNFGVIGNKEEVSALFRKYSEATNSNRLYCRVEYNPKEYNKPEYLGSETVYITSVIFDEQDLDTDEKCEKLGKLINQFYDDEIMVLLSIKDTEQKNRISKYLDLSSNWPKAGPEWVFFNLH